MALPTRTVTGTYLLPNGTTPAAGAVRITPNTRLHATAEDAIIPTGIEIALDATGHITTDLVPTDAPNVGPAGWAYRVTEIIQGADRRSYTINVPDSADPLDLADVAPLEPAPALVQYVLAATVGTAGGPAGPLDGSGKLPAAQLPAGSGVTSVNGDAGPAVDLDAGDVGADATGTAAAAVTAHTAATDPHGDRAAASAALAAHTGASTGVHGIADTAALETGAGSAAKVSAHAGAVDPHGDRAHATAQAAAAQASAEDYADTGDAARLAKAANLSDLADPAAARGNLGLGASATRNVGTTAGTVTAGDDARLSGAQQRSALTAKGDLYVATASGVVTRLPAGADGQVLVADSAQAAGVRWADPATGPTMTVSQARITSGDITLPNTAGAWQILQQAAAAGPFQISIPAIEGDYIDISQRGMRGVNASGYLDLVVVVGGSILRYLATGTSTPAAEGDPGLYPAAAFHPIAGSRGFTVGSGDLDGGNVTIALAVLAAGTGTLYASASYPWWWRLLNCGPPA